MDQSSSTSAADVSSQALGAIGTTTSEVEKVMANGTESVEGLQNDPLVANPPPVQEPRAEGRPDLEGKNDNDRCLYSGTP